MPSMATCSTLDGVFANDIVRVKAHRHQPCEWWSGLPDAKDIFDDDEDSMNGIDGDLDDEETGIFCQIQVQGKTDPATFARSPTYFSIQLSPLQVSEDVHARTSAAPFGIVYLPMPCMPRTTGL